MLSGSRSRICLIFRRRMAISGSIPCIESTCRSATVSSCDRTLLYKPCLYALRFPGWPPRLRLIKKVPSTSQQTANGIHWRHLRQEATIRHHQDSDSYRYISTPVLIRQAQNGSKKEMRRPWDVDIREILKFTRDCSEPAQKGVLLPRFPELYTHPMEERS